MYHDGTEHLFVIVSNMAFGYEGYIYVWLMCMYVKYSDCILKYDF